MVIRQEGEIRAWVWRGRLHTLSRIHATWVDANGQEWYRLEDTNQATFVIGGQESGWSAMPWPPAPDLYAVPKPPVVEVAKPARRARKAQ